MLRVGVRALPRRLASTSLTCAAFSTSPSLTRPSLWTVEDQTMPLIDLRSDTVSWPTREMRLAMANARVGDDVWGDDPTAAKLEEVASAMLGKEAAMFVTSGTQGNLSALLVHGRPGDEVILGKDSHIVLYEGGGMASLGGLMPAAIQNQVDGSLSLADIAAAIRTDDDHYPRSRLVVLENTFNGTPLSVEYTESVAALCKERGLRLHIDGARLFNAATALRRPAKDLVATADSVTFCLSKGLCSPAGSILSGSKEFIKEAKRKRKMLGGSMRQVGMFAAAGLISLQKMTLRLEEDHETARLIAKSIENLGSLGVSLSATDTNMVFFKLASNSNPTNSNRYTNSKNNDVNNVTKADLLVEKLSKRGVLIGGADEKGEFRLVTHYWVNQERAKEFLRLLEESLRELKSA